jgi:hypothetical protein
MDEQRANHVLETLDHIRSVRKKLFWVIERLVKRAALHDKSKLQSPEAPIFAEVTPKLEGVTYGSDEYEALLEELDEALQHHYAENSHHPEHYEDGVTGMDLLDVVEMFCDWLAATERHEDGDIFDSIDHNEERFNLDPQLAQIFRNTAERFDGPTD